jgi:hypothetical protein
MTMPQNETTVHKIAERLEREKQEAKDAGCPTAEMLAGYDIRGLWSCYADPGIMTADQGHKAMQLHRGCGSDSCWVRWRAREALVEAGRMVLDERAVSRQMPTR